MPACDDIGGLSGAETDRGAYGSGLGEKPATLSRSSARSLAGPLGAALLGFLLVLGVGFAGPQVLHNAAHDSRHSFSFPCH